MHGPARTHLSKKRTMMTVLAMAITWAARPAVAATATPACGLPPSAPFPRLGAQSLHEGQQGPGVCALQGDLDQLGFATSIDGYYGPKTAVSVSQFDRWRGLPVRGASVDASEGQLLIELSAGVDAFVTLDPAGLAHASAGAPQAIELITAAANTIAHYPYKLQGGHSTFQDVGYDSSGAISYALHAAGLLARPLDPEGFLSFGAPGPGRWLTIYSCGTHAIMTLGGLRYETTGIEGPTISRWRSGGPPGAGYIARHVIGL